MEGKVLLHGKGNLTIDLSRQIALQADREVNKVSDSLHRTGHSQPASGTTLWFFSDCSGLLQSNNSDGNSFQAILYRYSIDPGGQAA